MNALDIAFLIPLALFAWRGFSNGFVKEIVRIIGFIVVSFIAFNHMDLVLPYLKDAGVSAPLQPFLASLTLFLAGTIVVELVTRLLNRLIDASLLTVPNKLLGMLFGSLKVGLLFSFAYIFLAGMNIPNENARKASVTYPYLIQVVPVVYDVISAVYPGADDFLNTVKKNLPEADANQFQKYLE